MALKVNSSPPRSQEDGISVLLFAGLRLSDSVTPSSLSVARYVIFLWVYVHKVISDLKA